MSKVDDACQTNRLCETNAIDITGYHLVSQTDVYDETLTITPNGEHPSWIHNGLWNILNAAINAVAKCSKVTNTPICINPEAYCSSQPVTVTECVVPKFVGVNFQPADLGIAAPPFMEFSLSVAVDSASFCSTLARVGSAVAGAVNGVAGGLFPLWGLSCQ